MAAASYVQETAGTTDAAGAWTAGGANSMPALMTVGNIVILQVLQDGSTSGAVTVTGVGTSLEDISGTGSALTYLGEFPVGGSSEAIQHIWIGRAAQSSRSPNVSGSNSTSEDLFMRFYEFMGANAGTALSDVIENGSAGIAGNEAGTSSTINDCDVITLGADRLALNFVAVNDDNALDAFTGQSGGTWAEAVAEYADSAGTDGAIGLQTATIASAGTIGGGSDTMAASDAWGVVGFALIPASSATNLTPSGLSHTRAQGSPVVSPQLRPTGLEHTRALGSPAVSPQLRPSGLAHTRAQGSPTVSLVVNPAPASLEHTRALGSPIVSPTLVLTGLEHTRGTSSTALDTTLVVTGLAHTRAQGSPTGNPTGKATALDHGRTLGSPTLTSGITLLPAALERSRALGSPVVSPQTRPTGIVRARALGSPLASPTLSPAGLAQTRAIGTPNVVFVSLPASLVHTRALGAPQMNVALSFASLVRTRELGLPSFPGPPGMAADDISTYFPHVITH